MMITVPFQLTYSALSGALFLLWLILYVVNRKGRKAQIRMSVLFLIFLPLEFLYTHDYWHPTVHFANYLFGGYVGLEDIIFGFSFGGIITTLVSIFSTDRTLWTWRPALLSVAMIYIISLLLWIIGINSIFATPSAALLVVLFYSLRKATNAQRAAIGGVSALILMFIVYAGGFIVSSNTETVLQNIWLLYGTSLGIRVFGVPLTELLWALSFGAFAAVL